MLYLLFIPVAAVEILLAWKTRKWFWGLLLPAALLLLAAGRTVWDIAAQKGVSGAAVFLRLLPLLLALTVYGICRLRRRWQKLAAAVCMAMILPLPPMTANDGGSVLYQALSYRILFLHRIHSNEAGQTDGYLTGTATVIFPWNFEDDENTFERALANAVLEKE